ncbi:transmembrane protein, putative (macronuclear) [Tetrahymena thermophila SB210]|uniref:Transmembrane protein, putative n=1 Tax=Tetrahymena thermophila (strain SB210) TaxID=312017 RepID=Q22UB7_TETTS|nr:transmembrane protein, putative [Tetrahymena thermophila SB210]EAR88770.2 transmembrane protein, putative [Tetrahymena thermophila SB210]|eukprot:XP_001009015.2 transmembrane protein, putative [Tetrahymena thermophila SB210]
MDTNDFQACLINNCSALQQDQSYSPDLMSCLESYDECYDFVGDLTNSCNVNNCIVDCFDLFSQDSQNCYSQCMTEQKLFIQQSCDSQNSEMYFVDSSNTDNTDSNANKTNGNSNSNNNNNNNSTNSVNQDNFGKLSQADSGNSDSNTSLWIAIYCLIGTVILLIFLFLAYFIVKKRKNNSKINSKHTDLQQHNNNLQQQEQQYQQQILPPIQQIVIGVPAQENSFQIQKLPNYEINSHETKTFDQNQQIITNLNNLVKKEQGDSNKSEIYIINNQLQKLPASTAISTQLDQPKVDEFQQEELNNKMNDQVDNANHNANDEYIINFDNDELDG